MPSILIVEDHPYLAKALARYLQESGKLQVAAVAATGEEALVQLATLQVDLALIDVSLPEMTGIELVTRLRRDYPDLPCMMLSGHAADRFVRRSLAAGAQGYVIKDNLSAVLEGIQRVLAGENFVSVDPPDD
jgi:DNA-binding NarL/FixJ family response regulator